MARGPKKHLKRLSAPSNWMLAKMDGIWAPRTSTGPHKMRECLPLVIILRNRLKYALTKHETTMICMQKLVKVDGKVRTDPCFPAGFMDVVSLEKAGDQFRVLLDTKARYVLHRITPEESKYKLARVTKQGVGANMTPYITLHDGRTVRYADPLIKVNDTVKIDLETGKIAEVVKFEVGCVATVTRGRNGGRVGTIQSIERHPGSFDIVRIKDASNAVFATRLKNVFVVGKDKPLVSLPRGKGVKMSILEERAFRNSKGRA